MTYRVTIKFSAGGEAVLVTNEPPSEIIKMVKHAIHFEKGLMDYVEDGEQRAILVANMTTLTIRKA